MLRILMDHTIEPDELVKLEARHSRLTEQALYASIAIGVVLALTVGYLAPGKAWTSAALAMLVVAAVPILPAWMAYLDHRRRIARPLRIRADSEGIHLGRDFIAYLSVLQWHVEPGSPETEGRDVLALRTLRRTRRVFLPRDGSAGRVIEEFARRLGSRETGRYGGRGMAA